MVTHVLCDYTMMTHVLCVQYHDDTCIVCDYSMMTHALCVCDYNMVTCVLHVIIT